MAELLSFPEGRYAFIRGVAPYSAGVAAERGFEIERVRFAAPLPLEEAFDRIAARLREQGRPLTALCGCELRSPRPFTEGGFAEFNEIYLATLREWKIVRDGLNPVARSNVCPDPGAPPVPGIHAFSYTVPDPTGRRRSFQIAGSGEVPEGRSNYRDHIVRRGDLSPEGLREKVRWVFGEQERRLSALGFGWGDVTTLQVYTVHDARTAFAEEQGRRGPMGARVDWIPARPPIVEIDYEMDCRGISREIAL